MKKLSVALFVILFLAVAALFVLHFTGGSKGKESGLAGTSLNTPSNGIAYVNIDTIVLKFSMYADKRAEFLEKQKQAEAELNAKGTQYEKGVKDYQDKVNKGLVTRATAAEMEQALLKQQQDLVTRKDQLQQDLLEQDQVANRQILEYITTFLEQHKADYNYQYILGKSFGSVVLYGSSSNDITPAILDALNKQYQSEKK